MVESARAHGGRGRGGRGGARSRPARGARAGGAPARGHALRRARRRQALAAVSGRGQRRSVRRSAQQASVRVGAAIELIHAYSLVHDDLPAMDDALTRRGRPSCHRQYDEATAILVGDALQSLAFELLVDPATHPEPGVRCALVARLAAAAGPAGMCGGQMIDLLAEGRALDLEQILELQRLKTGALIGYACETGAIARRRFGRRAGGAARLCRRSGPRVPDPGRPFGRDRRRRGHGQGSRARRCRRQGDRGSVCSGWRSPGAVSQELRNSALAHLERLEGESGVLRAVFDFVISRSS